MNLAVTIIIVISFIIGLLFGMEVMKIKIMLYSVSDDKLCIGDRKYQIKEDNE